jgi:hypothetical protein
MEFFILLIWCVVAGLGWLVTWLSLNENRAKIMQLNAEVFDHQKSISWKDQTINNLVKTITKNMNTLESYIVIGEERITLSTDAVTPLTVPNYCAAATVAPRGGGINYTILDGVDPSATFGRPIPDQEEVVLINNAWVSNFKMRRTDAATTYVYVTYYSNA